MGINSESAAYVVGRYFYNLLVDNRISERFHNLDFLIERCVTRLHTVLFTFVYIVAANSNSDYIYSDDIYSIDSTYNLDNIMDLDAEVMKYIVNASVVKLNGMSGKVNSNMAEEIESKFAEIIYSGIRKSRMKNIIFDNHIDQKLKEKLLLSPEMHDHILEIARELIVCHRKYLDYELKFLTDGLESL